MIAPHIGQRAADASAGRAALAKGGRKRCQSCATNIPAAGLFAALLTLLSAGGGAAQDVTVTVPSGRALVYYDSILDDSMAEHFHRFRFVVPDLTNGDMADDSVAQDMADLCQSFALPKLQDAASQRDRIVIIWMSEPTEFGVANPEVTQFFESYSLSDGLCIWEAF